VYLADFSDNAANASGLFRHPEAMWRTVGTAAAVTATSSTTSIASSSYVKSYRAPELKSESGI
jgi:hypothetical protein